MAVEHGEHKVNEPDVSRLCLDLKAADQMPAGVSIVAFAALPDLDGGFDFKPDRLPALSGFGIDEIGIGLVGIMLVG